MADFVTVAKVTDIQPGKLGRVVVNGQRVMLANIGGNFYALRDECGQQRAALSKGPSWSVLFTSPALM